MWTDEKSHNNCSSAVDSLQPKVERLSNCLWRLPWRSLPTFSPTSLSGPLCQLCLLLRGKKQTKARSNLPKKTVPIASASHLHQTLCVFGRKVRHSCTEELQKSLFTTRAPLTRSSHGTLTPSARYRKLLFCFVLSKQNKKTKITSNTLTVRITNCSIWLGINADMVGTFPPPPLSRCSALSRYSHSCNTAVGGCNFKQQILEKSWSWSLPNRSGDFHFPGSNLKQGGGTKANPESVRTGTSLLWNAWTKFDVWGGAPVAPLENQAICQPRRRG